MGCLRDPNYVREFAYRTKLNFYRNMYLYGNNEEEYSQKIEALEKVMNDEGYVIEEYYEVTDLINSMIGLLIFPEQNLYDYLSDNEEDLRKFFPTMFSCIQNNEYVNTYASNERYSPKDIIRHIRNSFSHDKVLLYPRNSKNKEKIKKIIIQDYCIRSYINEQTQKDIQEKINQHVGDIRELRINQYIKLFSIEIPVEVFEKFVMEICDYALSESK